jgi:hypothetical protein
MPLAARLRADRRAGRAWTTTVVRRPWLTRLRLVEEVRAVGRILERREAAAAEQFAVLLVVGLRAQFAAGQLRIAVIEAAGHHAVARRVAGLPARRRGGRQVGGHVARHRGVVAIAVEVETIDGQLQKARIFELVAALGKAVAAFGIHQVALGAVDAD